MENLKFKFKQIKPDENGNLLILYWSEDGSSTPIIVDVYINNMHMVSFSLTPEAPADASKKETIVAKFKKTPDKNTIIGINIRTSAEPMATSIANNATLLIFDYTFVSQPE